VSAEVHFIHCGDGDTILIRGGEQWGLMDANFVTSLRVRDEVERLLEGVERLRFVCVTHFDLDHIRGLGKFLRGRFSESDGRGGTRWLVDQFILPIRPVSLKLLKFLKKLRPLGSRDPLLKGDLSGEAHALLDVLCEIGEGRLKRRGSAAAELPEFLCLATGQDLFGPPRDPMQIGMGPWRCRSLGPQDETAALFIHQLEAACRGEVLPADLFRRVSSNDVSRVFAFQHSSTGCTVLLTGDATPPELGATLTAWKRLGALEQHANGDCFRVVKASHHGARTCHLPEIYSGHCQPGYSHVVICASDDGQHPHEEVIAGIGGLSIEHSVTGTNSSEASPRLRGANVPLGAPRSTLDSGDPHVRVIHSGPGCVVSGGRRSRHQRGATSRRGDD
jgi:hypothetical protein